MLDYNLLKTKTRCLQIYFLISESSETARDAIASIETRGINSENILITCNKTLDFAHKITSQLINYTKDVEDYILEINKSLNNDVKNVQIKKEKSPRKSILSLKKEQNEESTQDEFLEIYKIDMTEDLSTPYQKTSTFKTILEKDATSSDDNSKQTVLQLDENELNCPKIEDKNDDNLLEKISNGSVNSLNEDDILKNIGCDTSDIESDCDTLFSGSTLVLEENLDMSKKLEDLNEFLSPDRNKEVDDNANINEENNFNLMQCSVVLSKCDMEKTVSTEENNVDKEMRQIENLINLDNLKRKHSAEHTKPNKRRKKEKINDKDSSHSTDALSDSSATECGTFSISAEQDDIDKQESLGGTDEKAAKERDEFLNGLLNCISDASDVLENVSEGDHSGSDVGSTKNKKTANNEKVIIEDKIDSNQENDTENDVSVEIIENDALDGKKNEKKKWRQDKLLTAKIASDSSDCEKENDPEHRQKRKKRRKVRRKSASDFLSVQQPTSSESEHLSGSEFEDIGSDTYISSDSTSSEVEFVKSFTKESSTKNDEQGKVGRRNIRSVRSDALLGATTKKAQREEEERLDRLEPRTQLLSQLAEESGLVLDFDKETKESLITVDQNITTRLKHHQKEGLRFMWNSCYESVETLKKSQGTGCILAHCMGLGKTFQVTSLINTLFAHDITNTKHVLILCPLSTVLNWEDEFKICYMTSKHKKRVKRYLITDGKSKDERYRIVSNWYKNNGVLIMGYDSFQSLLNKAVPKKIVEALLDPGPDLVVCDEGHMIKNGARNRTKTLTRIKTKRRIILTGTPMQNNLTEYYYMVDFVKPNLLGTKTEFSNRFINPIVNGGYDDSTETDIKIMRQRSHVLHEYLKHTIQRFEITELQSYLPEKIDYVLFIRMHELQIELYKAYLEIVSAESDKKNRKFFIDYMRLKDLWTHPCILRLKEQSKSSQQNKRKEVDTVIVEPEIQEDMPNEWWHSKCPDDVMTNIEYGPKMNVMLEIVEHSVRLGDKVLIFGSYLAELDAIECFLNTNGWRKNVSYLRMDGTVPPDVRTSFCKKFNNKNEDRIKLFVLSHQVGGLGLNLIAANRIILMDVNFNPAIDSQSIFRTYRFGQEKRCYVYRLVSMGTMEEVVYERSVTKQAVSLRVVDEHQISRHYKSNDLQKMYRFNIYTDAERPVLKLPADEILATILEKCKKEIFKYHEHEDLLENRPEEQLNTEEQKLAWDEFRREQENAYQNHVTATNLQMQNAALLNQGVFPANQIVASTSQPSTSSIPLQSQAVPTSTITPQTTAFASIRLQNFANIANMNQQQYIVGLSSAINAKNSVNIRLPNNGVMGVPLIRQQIPKTRQDIASRSIVPNITILPNGKYQSASSGQRMPNILSRGSKILHPSTSTTRQQNATVIPTATTSNARSESTRIRNLSEPSNEVPTTSSAYNNLPQLLPLTLVNVENNTSERWSTQMSNKTSDQNKKLQQADPLATKNKTEITSTSGLVITVGNPNNSNESSKQQVVQTQPNNTGWPKSKVHAQNAPAKADATIETRMANNGVDCIIELD